MARAATTMHPIQQDLEAGARLKGETTEAGARATHLQPRVGERQRRLALLARLQHQQRGELARAEAPAGARARPRLHTHPRKSQHRFKVKSDLGMVPASNR